MTIPDELHETIKKCNSKERFEEAFEYWAFNMEEIHARLTMIDPDTDLLTEDDYYGK